jgi:hypothetical protein
MADGSQLPGLAFWGRNMAPIRARGWIWPGFEYSEAEWRRLLSLAGAVSFEAFLSFQVATAVLTIALIALVVGGGAAIITPVYQTIPAAWAAARLLGVLIAMAIAAFLLFGYGLPLAMRAATAFAASDAMRAKLVASPSDTDLAGKIARQFRRVAAFIAVMLFLVAASEAYLPESVQHWVAITLAIGSGFVAIVFL